MHVEEDYQLCSQIADEQTITLQAGCLLCLCRENRINRDVQWVSQMTSKSGSESTRQPAGGLNLLPEQSSERSPLRGCVVNVPESAGMTG